MAARIRKKSLVFISVFIFVVIGAAAFWLVARRPLSTETPTADVFPETFTFFSLGANTQLSEDFKKSFRKILGTEAVAENTPMNLEIHGQGFLQRHLNVLHELNQSLNSRRRARIEHPTIQLSYRHSVWEQKIFQYVIILFSKHNHQPLMVEIASKDRGYILVDNLKNKYGDPLIIDAPEIPGKALCWKQENDYAVASETPDRHGKPTYRIKFYFADNIRKLIKTEEQPGQKRIEDTGKPALF